MSKVLESMVEMSTHNLNESQVNIIIEQLATIGINETIVEEGKVVFIAPSAKMKDVGYALDMYEKLPVLKIRTIDI